MNGEERVVVTRQFDVDLELSDGDGRTVIGRCVPYNAPARVKDEFGPVYREAFLPGAFQEMAKAPNRVGLNYRHGTGLMDYVGKCVALDEQPDGLYGTFRLFDDAEGNKARTLVQEGVLTGLSVEADIIRSVHSPDGVVQRAKARLTGVALCQNPAYVDAEVLAVREAPGEILIPEFDPALAERVGRFVALPEGLQTT